MPVAEIGNYLYLAVFVVELLFVGLRVQHIDPVLVKICQGPFFISAQLDAAEFFIAQIIDADYKACTFFVQKYG